jgi:hypothetical protein
VTARRAQGMVHECIGPPYLDTVAPDAAGFTGTDNVSLIRDWADVSFEPATHTAQGLMVLAHRGGVIGSECLSEVL